MARVVSVTTDGGAYLIRLEAAEIAAAALPFQFIMVRVPAGGYALRRPFSVFDAQGECLEILLRPCGAGTRILAAVAVGEALDLTGPMGRAFEPPAGALFVAGGIGVAGVAFALAAAHRRDGVKRPLVYGARTKGQLAALARLEEVADVTVVTDDGSAGARGVVSDYVEAGERPVVACGPRPMLAALRSRLSSDAAYYVVMEERMACGVGVCRSCAVPAAANDGYLAVCEHGPVIPSCDVDWGRLEVDI